MQHRAVFFYRLGAKPRAHSPKNYYNDSWNTGSESETSAILLVLHAGNSQLNKLPHAYDIVHIGLDSLRKSLNDAYISVIYRPLIV